MQDLRHPPSTRPIPAQGYPFTPPGPAERAALGRVSAYLRRAGNEVESRALLPALPCGPPEADLRALRESLRSAAALCDGMAEIAAGSDVPPHSALHTRPSWNREAPG